MSYRTTHFLVNLVIICVVPDGVVFESWRIGLSSLNRVNPVFYLRSVLTLELTDRGCKEIFRRFPAQEH